jgi:hypothetical protein
MKSKSKFNFGVKTNNNPDITSIEGVFNWLDTICDNEKEYTDQELSDKLEEVSSFCCGNNLSRSFYFIQHHRSEKLVEMRAIKYCKKHKIKLENYMGVLPYRKFIDTIPYEVKNRKLKIEKIIKKLKREIIFNKFKSIWKRINIIAN